MKTQVKIELIMLVVGVIVVSGLFLANLGVKEGNSEVVNVFKSLPLYKTTYLDVQKCMKDNSFEFCTSLYQNLVPKEINNFLDVDIGKLRYIVSQSGSEEFDKIVVIGGVNKSIENRFIHRKEEYKGYDIWQIISYYCILKEDSLVCANAERGTYWIKNVIDSEEKQNIDMYVETIRKLPEGFVILIQSVGDYYPQEKFPTIEGLSIEKDGNTFRAILVYRFIDEIPTRSIFEEKMKDGFEKYFVKAEIEKNYEVVELTVNNVTGEFIKSFDR